MGSHARTAAEAKRPAVPSYPANPRLMSTSLFQRTGQSQPLGLVADNTPRADHTETKYLKELADGDVISAIRQEFDRRHVSPAAINHILMATVEAMRLYPMEADEPGPHLQLLP